MVECSSGHYADGFYVGFDSTMGWQYDDSYLTAITLRCSDGSLISSRHSTGRVVHLDVEECSEELLRWFFMA